MTNPFEDMTRRRSDARPSGSEAPKAHGGPEDLLAADRASRRGLFSRLGEDGRGGTPIGSGLGLAHGHSVVAIGPTGPDGTGAFARAALGGDDASVVVVDAGLGLPDALLARKARDTRLFVLDWTAVDDVRPGPEGPDVPEGATLHPRVNPIGPGWTPPDGSARENQVDAVCRALVPSKRGGGDDYFLDKGRCAMSGLIHALLALTAEGAPDARPPGWEGMEPSIPMLVAWMAEAYRDAEGDVAGCLERWLSDVLRLLERADGPPATDATAAARRRGATRSAAIALRELRPLLHMRDRERAGILATVDQCLIPFKNGAVRERMSASDLVPADLRGMTDPADGSVRPVTLVLRSDAASAPAFATINGLVVDGLVRGLFRDDGVDPARPVRFVLDGLERLGRIGSVVDGPDLGRSTRIAFALGVNDVAALDATYGAASARAIRATTAATLLLPQRDPVAAEAAAATTGVAVGPAELLVAPAGTRLAVVDRVGVAPSGTLAFRLEADAEGCGTGDASTVVAPPAMPGFARRRRLDAGTTTEPGGRGGDRVDAAGTPSRRSEAMSKMVETLSGMTLAPPGAVGTAVMATPEGPAFGTAIDLAAAIVDERIGVAAGPLAGGGGMPFGEGSVERFDWIEGSRRLRLTLPHGLSAVILGPPGAGKTAAFVIPAVLSDDASQVVLDPKPELYAACAGAKAATGRVAAFDWSARDGGGRRHLRVDLLGAGWLPSPGPDRDAYLDAVATALVEAPWLGAARTARFARDLVAGLAHALVDPPAGGLPVPGRDGAAPARGATLPDLADLVLDLSRAAEAAPLTPWLPALVRACAEGGRFGGYVRRLAPLAALPEADLAAALAAAREATTPFRDPAARERASGSDLVPADFRGTSGPDGGPPRPVTLFLTTSATRFDGFRAPTAALVEALAFRLLRDGGTAGGGLPVRFMLDEGSKLPRIAAVEAGEGVTRPAGVSFVTAAQDRDQLGRGRGGDASAVEAAAAVRVFVGTTDPDDLRVVAAACRLPDAMTPRERADALAPALDPARSGAVAAVALVDGTPHRLLAEPWFRDPALASRVRFRGEGPEAP